MALSCGLIGMPAVGKSTFFKLLTGADISIGTYADHANIKIANIPDKRIDWLTKLFEPKKTTFAQLEIIDIPGLQGSGNSREFLSRVDQVDALVHVVRAFREDQVFHIDGSVNPMRDLDTVNSELLLADLQLVETRIERINAAKKRTAEQEKELKVMERLQETLENEQRVATVELNADEQELLQHVHFLTDKPMIVVINLDEEQLSQGYAKETEIKKYCGDMGLRVLEICAKVEMEINELPAEERVEFLQDMGIEETGIVRLAEVIYDTLGLISFLTVGTDEVRAWPIDKGLTARQAAGKIHSDIARGFIRAEVVSFQDFHQAGSMDAVKEKGQFRLEDKDYIVHDGDIVSFRFNI
ncbi:redox-regulated ATPase YchF [Metallumcola ferriviriculae]|uniref:Redox-regulated ATPase YchF n=1 Tax=Metallumcola ferriviriculae TaxID=3039180 RepID=A0AAU0UM93_9FIRM|nr:redox-regulated ATPase YchF [Desulfitibacteraceae bacterium MK1]